MANANHIYIKEGATLHIRRRGALTCGVMDDVRETCVPALYAPVSGVSAVGVLPDAVCGVVMRPQGGGGVDHPTKVQQNKAQTEILSLSILLLSFLLLSLLCTHFLSFVAIFFVMCPFMLCFGYISSLWISFAEAPGVLTTLKSNLCFCLVKFVNGGVGISYPLDIID